MKRIFLPVFLFTGWMFLMTHDIPVHESFLPAPGRFFNPFTGFWKSVTPRGQKQIVKGIVGHDVNIQFDQRAVPHIYAASDEDALFAQGYLHAANRLFQMDITTRAAAGRLSELMGPRTLELDRRRREMGMEYSAIQKAAYWATSPETKSLIDAYVRGVNAYIHSLHYREWPVEYKLLSHPPREWSDLQTALAATSLAISLCLGENDAEYTAAHQKLSAADFTYLYPDHNPLESPVIPKEKTWDFHPLRASKLPGDQTGETDSRTDHLQEEYLNGSNNWAVSPQRTASGAPILANDPHLNLTLPGIWYEVELHTPARHVHGVSMPGLPFVLIGFNDSIAWGSTNSGQDVLDWYTIRWKDNNKTQYLIDGKYQEAQLRPEEILIRGRKPELDTIRYTRWGPVSHLNDSADVAMKWIGHQKATSNDVNYLVRISQAKNVDDYRKAIAEFQYPAQNQIFASVQGDIAISVAGVIPVRPDGLGEIIADGTDSRNDWDGFIPFEQAPYIINPARGYVSSANQAPADTSYPYPLLGKRIFEDYRGRMVNRLLDSANQVRPGDMMAMQQNNFDLHASEVLPILIQTVQTQGCTDEHGAKILSLLSRWNFETDQDSLAPVYADLWYNALETMTWDELDTLHLMYPESWRFVEIIRHDPDSRYFDIITTPDVKENFSSIACLSFDRMLKNFETLAEARKTSWAAYKQSSIPHLARFPHFGIDYLPESGGKHIINAMSGTHGPSWRMVVELSDPPVAWVNYPGGQSGDPADVHYRDFVADFFAGKYYEVRLLPDDKRWVPVSQIRIQAK